MFNETDTDRGHTEAALNRLEDHVIENDPHVNLTDVAIVASEVRLLRGRCHCNQPTAARVNSHQRGDEAFCRDSFEGTE